MFAAAKVKNMVVTKFCKMPENFCHHIFAAVVTIGARNFILKFISSFFFAKLSSK